MNRMELKRLGWRTVARLFVAQANPGLDLLQHLHADVLCLDDAMMCVTVAMCPLEALADD